MAWIEHGSFSGAVIQQEQRTGVQEVEEVPEAASSLSHKRSRRCLEMCCYI